MFKAYDWISRQIPQNEKERKEVLHLEIMSLPRYLERA
jgi:hypothetical protein